MDNVFRMIGDVVGQLTSILIGVLGLGIVAALVFGDAGLGIDAVSYTHLTLPTIYSV